MFAFTILCVSFFVSLVHASPLNIRDVFSPHITSPDENTVWPVGTKQTVTWETQDIPPDSQLTNPNGKVVLGHLGPTGGLNLQLDNPLAQNFKLRVGKIDIIVPSVPPRDDYIIVLFGDSGNASPAFAITRITGGSNFTTTSTGTEQSTTTSTSTEQSTTTSTGTEQSTTIRPSSSSATSSVPTPITEPIPIIGTTITGGESTPSNEPTITSAETTAQPSPTSPTQAEPTSTQTGTAVLPATTSNAALGLSRLGAISTSGLASLALTFLLCI